MSGPASGLKAEVVARRALVVTLCEILTHPEPELVRAALLDCGALGEGEWRGFWDKPLAWIVAHRLATGEKARRFDAFWLLIEEQHAALLAADAAAPASPPQSA